MPETQPALAWHARVGSVLRALRRGSVRVGRGPHRVSGSQQEEDGPEEPGHEPRDPPQHGRGQAQERKSRVLRQGDIGRLVHVHNVSIVAIKQIIMVLIFCLSLLN